MENSGRIKKGEVRNPGGRPALPDDLKLLMKTTSESMKRDICDVWSMDVSLLMQSESKPGMSAGKAALISCLNNSIQSGDTRGLTIMLDRILGKVQDAAEIDEDSREVLEKLNAVSTEMILKIVKEQEDKAS